MTRAALPLLLAAIAAPAAAQQQSEGYKLLSAIREAKGNDVLAILNKPGSTVINTRDISTGEGALHIVAKRGDETYLRFLLQKGADPNLKDGRGNTPLLLAVNGGHADLIPVLVAGRANVNLANGAGETPLIRAVQRRDVAAVRALLQAGADADQADVIAGQSARDYARIDARNPALSQMLAEAPKRSARTGVAGPR